MKFVLHILCLPLVAICCSIKCIAMLTIKCGCYILSPVLMFLGVCCVFTTITYLCTGGMYVRTVRKISSCYRIF